MSTAEEVENAVKVSLAEWGVKHGNNEEHQIFRNNAIQSALNIFNCNYESTSDSEEEDDITKENKLLDEGLPNNLVEAVKYALCQEFKMTKERYYISVDLLKNSNKLPDIAYYPPYFYNQYPLVIFMSPNLSIINLPSSFNTFSFLWEAMQSSTCHATVRV